MNRRSAIIGSLATAHAWTKRAPSFPPADTQGGWRTARAKRQPLLDRLFGYIQKSTTHGGLLVVHRGWLVYERYFGLGDRAATPKLASIGKSVTSVAAGILMTEEPKRFPEGLDQTVCTPDYLPRDAFPLSDPRRANIKLGQLLAMTAGLLGNHPGYVLGNPVTLDPPGPDGWKALLDEAATRFLFGAIQAAVIPTPPLRRTWSRS
jgi:CubicO group peptidase (beta-lactamase class C family)